MKIRNKKQMNLPQLIEWGFNNAVKNQSFLTHDNEGNTSEVYFNIRGLPKFSSMVDKSDTFTVEEETEITEDTWFPKLVSRTVSGNYHLWKQGSINDFKYLSFNDLNAFYIPNDDLTMTLIWTHEKGLVE